MSRAARRPGVPSVALDLPMTTLDADAAVLSHAVPRLRATRWSSPTPGAATSPRSAPRRPQRPAPHLHRRGADQAGHPTLAPSAVPPARAAARVTMRSKVVTETATTTEIDCEASLEVFYPDVDPELARQAAAGLRPFQKAGYQVIETDARSPCLADGPDNLRGVAPGPR